MKQSLCSEFCNTGDVICVKINACYITMNNEIKVVGHLKIEVDSFDVDRDIIFEIDIMQYCLVHSLSCDMNSCDDLFSNGDAVV